MYEVTLDTFRTPRGHPVTMGIRTGTNDWNTLNACMTEDEYGLRDLRFEGTALDVGAYIGGVTIALALDNPELLVVAIEAVPPNVDLLRENVERAGVSDRVTILHAAAGEGQTAEVKWAFAGDEVSDHHAFVGNAQMPELATSTHKTEVVPVVTLADLVLNYGSFCFAKVDCEGCEYPFLKGPALIGVDRIHGEEHYGPLDLPGFEVKYTQDNAPRGFEAVRK